MQALMGGATRQWWDAAYRSGRGQTWTVWKDPKLADHIACFLPSHARVLILACGSGWSGQALAVRRPDIKLWGCDFSMEALKLAHQTEVAWRGLHHEDLNEFPWPYVDNGFDVVIVSEILEQLEDPPRAIAECRRIAKRLAITVPVSPDLSCENNAWTFEPKDLEQLYGYSQSDRGVLSSTLKYFREERLLCGLVEFE